MLKEPDFATNLRTGPYRNTALAQAFENSRTAGKLTIADFEAYEPSLGQPSAFICTPVIKDGTKDGVLALQLSNVESITWFQATAVGFETAWGGPETRGSSDPTI